MLNPKITMNLGNNNITNNNILKGLNKTELELKQKITNIQNEIMKYEKKKRQYNVLEKD